MAGSASSPGRQADRLGLGRLVAGIAVFVALGIPLTAFVWESLNELFAGRVRPIRLLITVPVVLLLLFLWRILGRTVQRWDAARRPEPDDRRIP
jgi:hypothetical protein